MTQETRHYHGKILHDHVGGNVPHDHENLPRSGTANPFRGEAMLGIGFLAAILGGIAMLWQSNNHAACNPAWVQALSQNQCPEANAIWTLGILGLVIGALLVITGAIFKAARKSS